MNLITELNRIDIKARRRFGSSADEAAGSKTIRVMTYNIHKGIGGMDRRYDLARIIEVIAKYDPALVMLQEVDEGVPRSRGDLQVALMARELGYSFHAYQRNVAVKKGHYGNAILSRYPLRGVEHLDLTIPMKKRRRALLAEATWEWQGQPFSIVLCNAHLGLAGFERRVQVRRILDSFQSLSICHRTPAILAGDFNDVWSTLGRRLILPAGFRCAVGRKKTFPASLPLRGLDAVYYRGGLQLRSSFAAGIKLARQASDHLPVIADFNLASLPQHIRSERHVLLGGPSSPDAAPPEFKSRSTNIWLDESSPQQSTPAGHARPRDR